LFSECWQQWLHEDAQQRGQRRTIMAKTPQPFLQEKRSIHCKPLGFDIEVGSFVLYERESVSYDEAAAVGAGAAGATTSRSVARLLDTKNCATGIRCAMIQMFDYLDRSELKTLRKPCADGATKYINEVVQTTRTGWVDSSCVKCLCFVFPAKQLEDELFGTQGISNVFLVRYNSDGSDVSVSDFKRFASEYEAFAAGLCTPCMIWQDLQRTQLAIRRIMSSVRQGQGSYTQQSAKVVIGPETWAYISRHLAETSHQVLVSKMVRCSLRIERNAMGSGLETRKTSVLVEGERIRWESHAELAVLIGLFGEGCVFGLRKRPRKLSPAYLNAYDEINYLSGYKEPSENPLGRSTRTGIDTTFCKYNSELRISCRYKRCVFAPPTGKIPSKRLRVLIDRGDPAKADTHTNSSAGDASSNAHQLVEQDTVLLEVGEEFMLDGELVQICRMLTCGDVLVQRPDGSQIIVNQEVAQSRLKDYIT